MYFVAFNGTQDEDTGMFYVTYHFFDTLFYLLSSNQLYSLSTTYLLKWDKMEFLFTRTNGLPLFFNTIPDAVVSALKLTLPPAPAPDDGFQLNEHR